MNEYASNEWPHRRQNLLTGEWVLVSPHRMRRPWQGRHEATVPDAVPAYDPECYLCPGNQRADGQRTPDYPSTLVFTNDYPALLPDAGQPAVPHPLLRSERVRGTSRVICFSPRHDLTLPRMSTDEIAAVIGLWAEQTADLGRDYRWVQIFENKGQQMGASNPHPHGQIWAMDVLPTVVASEDARQREYFAAHGRPLLIDYANAEADGGVRVVVSNEHWLAVVPYWAVWPFETIVIPRAHVLRLPDLDPVQRTSLADLLKRLLTRYDNLFETPFPYSMGWHGAPYDAGEQTHWQLHAHFYPPLLRSATVRKFMVGFEMLGESQRDLTPERAAEQLQAASEVHYLERGA